LRKVKREFAAALGLRTLSANVDGELGSLLAAEEEAVLNQALADYTDRSHVEEIGLGAGLQTAVAGDHLGADLLQSLERLQRCDFFVDESAGVVALDADGRLGEGVDERLEGGLLAREEGAGELELLPGVSEREFVLGGVLETAHEAVLLGEEACDEFVALLEVVLFELGVENLVDVPELNQHAVFVEEDNALHFHLDKGFRVRAILSHDLKKRHFEIIFFVLINNISKAEFDSW